MARRRQVETDSDTLSHTMSSSTSDRKDSNEKSAIDVEISDTERIFEDELNVTEDDLRKAKDFAETIDLETTKKMMENVLKIHERDPNFPFAVLVRIHEFLSNEDVFERPEKHEDLIWEMKLEAALITNNSPYAEVRAVVSNEDDPDMPSSTIRMWTIGIAFSIFLAFINQLFSIRQPQIFVESNVAQLLAYPVGKAWEKLMPDWGFTLWGIRHSLNPGPFNKKEHMLIAIMATTSKSLPYSQYIVWTQVMPHWFNQQWARSFGYQILIAISTNFLGYGLAGLTRRFLVYPSYCVWPATLVTVALNSALHNESNFPVPGPLRKIFTMSRFKFFMLAFGAMFVYFWLPNWLVPVMTAFSWMTWIAPKHRDLNILTGFNNGMGLLNFWPTWDWNVLLFTGIDPLMVPAFSTFNSVAGCFVLGWLSVGLWYANVWNTGYIPIVSNKMFNHWGGIYNVSMALNEQGLYDNEKYMNYSAVYLSAAQVVAYFSFFAVYSSTVMYVALFHRYEIAMGFKSLWRSLRNRGPRQGSLASGDYEDVHVRLMRAYPEVSEYWYFGVLVVAAATGMAGIATYPTYTTIGVVPYGIILALLFVVPTGIIRAMTGVEVTLNVLAEFIGGMWVEGNALAMNFFKSFGYVTCAHALSFSNDLKLAHYLKIAPRQTFAAQMVATLISTFVCVGVFQFQMDIPDVCTPEAPMRFTCPTPQTFYTASVLWGTIGPLKIFGANGQYSWSLLGWPIGFAAPLLFYLLIRKYPRNRFVRQIHPVAIWTGALNYCPYSFSYMWPSVPIAWLSWIYIRGRYLAFWSKYNFVLSAAFSAGVAIAGILMLFTVQWYGIEIKWWGSTQAIAGCEGKPCLLKTLGPNERFYPWWDGTRVPAP